MGTRLITEVKNMASLWTGHQSYSGFFLEELTRRSYSLRITEIP